MIIRILMLAILSQFIMKVIHRERLRTSHLGSLLLHKDLKLIVFTISGEWYSKIMSPKLSHSAIKLELRLGIVPQLMLSNIFQ